MLTCRSCGDVVTEKEVAARWGPSGSWPRSVPEAVTRRRATADGITRSGRAVPRDDECVRKPLGGFAVGLRIPRNQPLHRFPERSSARRRRCWPAGCRPSAPTACFSRRDKPGRHALATNSPRRAGRSSRCIVTALQCGQHWFHAPEGPAVMHHPSRLRQAVHRRTDLRPVRAAAEGHAGQRAASGIDRRVATTTNAHMRAQHRGSRGAHHRRTGRRRPTPAA